MINIDDFNLIIMFRFVLLVTCSVVIGFNRGMMNQFAGLKTHMFVGMGAGLSFLIPYVFYAKTGYAFDPFRLSAQVISGIGFLGAGTILKSGQSIKGLTTAAGLWATAIVAIAIASGLYSISILSTVTMILLLKYSKKLDITRRYSTVKLTMTIKNMEENLPKINEFMKTNTALQNKYTILEYINDGVEDTAMIKYDIIHRQTDMSINQVIKELAKYEYVTKLDLVTELERV